jgi:hypothetical protein
MKNRMLAGIVAIPMAFTSMSCSTRYLIKPPVIEYTSLERGLADAAYDTLVRIYSPKISHAMSIDVYKAGEDTRLYHNEQEDEQVRDDWTKERVEGIVKVFAAEYCSGNVERALIALSRVSSRVPSSNTEGTEKLVEMMKQYGIF